MTGSRSVIPLSSGDVRGINERILEKLKACSGKDRLVNEFLRKLLYEDPGSGAWWKKHYEQLIETYAAKWEGSGASDED